MDTAVFLAVLTVRGAEEDSSLLNAVGRFVVHIPKRSTAPRTFEKFLRTPVFRRSSAVFCGC